MRGGGEVCVSIQKMRVSIFFPPSEMVDEKINRFIRTHIIRTAHNWFCVFCPGLTIYITTVVYFFSSSSWSTGGIDLCSDLKKEMAVSWTQLCSMKSTRQLLWLIKGKRTRKLPGGRWKSLKGKGTQLRTLMKPWASTHSCGTGIDQEPTFPTCPNPHVASSH